MDGRADSRYDIRYVDPSTVSVYLIPLRVTLQEKPRKMVRRACTVHHCRHCGCPCGLQLECEFWGEFSKFHAILGVWSVLNVLNAATKLTLATTIC